MLLNLTARRKIIMCSQIFVPKAVTYTEWVPGNVLITSKALIAFMCFVYHCPSGLFGWLALRAYGQKVSHNIQLKANDENRLELGNNPSTHIHAWMIHCFIHVYFSMAPNTTFFLTGLVYYAHHYKPKNCPPKDCWKIVVFSLSYSKKM